MNAITVVGWSGSGKTTLIVTLIEALKQRGLTVMTLKNVPEKYNFQPKGKDSFKFLDAGADSVYLTSKGEIVEMRRYSGPSELHARIKATFDSYDLVILEGLVIEGVPVFVTDPFPERSQACAVANKKFSDIESPKEFDRQDWIERLCMSHWNFDELSSGKAWAHMRQFCK